MARRSSPLRQVSKTVTIPAPIGGWNARDPLSAMKVEDAIILDNLVPGTGGVELRKGYSVYATGISGTVESLMEYNAPSGGAQLFAAAGTSVYDVTDAGAVGSADLTSMGNARFSHVMFGTPGGNFLVCCNGAASVRNYNGSSWTTPSISGVTSADLIHVAVHASRLWFTEKNTLSVWYLDPNAIAGTATEFNMSSQFRLGGQLLCMASWTRDGGTGSDDVAIFITDRGEVLIYSGNDPSDATTWQKVGLFRIPEPVGRRCFVKYGADLAIITSQGLLPLSDILPIALSDAVERAITDKIKGAFRDAYKASGALYGWQVVEYPKGGLLIVNVPQGTGSTSDQYVLVSQTKAWCRFKGLNAIVWSQLGDAIYFGTSDGTVCLFDNDYTDDGESIRFSLLPAFSSYGVPAFKRFLMARPLYTAAYGIVPQVALKTDYDTTLPSLTQNAVPENGSDWDTSDWDTASWGPPIVAVNDWQSIEGIGQVGSIYLQVYSQTPITLNQIDVLFEVGGIF